MFENDPLGFIDLNKNVSVGKINAIRTVHDKLPCTARFHVKLVNSHRKTLRAPPFRQMLLFRPSIKHKIPWSIKYTGDHNLAFTYLRCGLACFVILVDVQPSKMNLSY
ncbi:hypothetical protein PAEVO_20720 [Paenibacillus sp. GM2FR]|nr:hypothetical protein PAEVO_20720 [Paenibacillus sp. GM2FR]